MGKKMFKLKRVEDDQQNSIRVTTPEGSVEIKGTSAFVVRMFKSLCEESTEFFEVMRANLAGMTREQVAAEMRRAGFDERIVRDFENYDYWDDIINL